MMRKAQSAHRVGMVVLDPSLTGSSELELALAAVAHLLRFRRAARRCAGPPTQPDGRRGATALGASGASGWPPRPRNLEAAVHSPRDTSNVKLVAVDGDQQPMYLLRAAELVPVLALSAAAGVEGEDMPGLHGLCVEAIRSAGRHGR